MTSYIYGLKLQPNTVQAKRKNPEHYFERSEHFFRLVTQKKKILSTFVVPFS